MATPTYGTIGTLDTLAANLQTVAVIGEQNVYETINQALAAYNEIMREQLERFCEFGTTQMEVYGANDAMEMQDLDSYGIPDAQHVQAYDTLGFPLRKKGNALQWTRDALQILTGSEIAGQFTAMQSADRSQIIKDIKRGLFNPTNTTFRDYLINNITLNVKALVNADSAPIPLGPDNEEFDGATHTHYFGSATLTNAAVDNVIKTVVEHYGGGSVMLFINKSMDSAMNALTNFTRNTPVGFELPDSVVQTGRTLNPMRATNRQIGMYTEGSAEVWVKPFVPYPYLFAYVEGQPKPLRFRTRPGVAGAGDLQLVYDNETYPLRARAYQREYGIAVRNRTNGAALYIGGGSYVAPTF